MRSVECVDRFPHIPHSSLFYVQIAENYSKFAEESN